VGAFLFSPGLTVTHVLWTWLFRQQQRERLIERGTVMVVLVRFHRAGLAIPPPGGGQHFTTLLRT